MPLFRQVLYVQDDFTQGSDQPNVLNKRNISLTQGRFPLLIAAF